MRLPFGGCRLKLHQGVLDNQVRVERYDLRVVVCKTIKQSIISNLGVAIRRQNTALKAISNWDNLVTIPGSENKLLLRPRLRRRGYQQIHQYLSREHSVNNIISILSGNWLNSHEIRKFTHVFMTLQTRSRRMLAKAHMIEETPRWHWHQLIWSWLERQKRLEMNNFKIS